MHNNIKYLTPFVLCDVIYLYFLFKKLKDISIYSQLILKTVLAKYV